jgi:ATP-dependent Lon protease
MEKSKKTARLPCLWSSDIILPGVLAVVARLRNEQYIKKINEDNPGEIIVFQITDEDINLSSKKETRIGALCLILDKKTHKNNGFLELELKLSPIARMQTAEPINNEMRTQHYFYADFEVFQDDYSECVKEKIKKYMITVIDGINNHISNPDLRFRIIYNIMLGNALSEIIEIDAREKEVLEELLSNPCNSFLFNHFIQDKSDNPVNLSGWIDSIAFSFYMESSPNLRSMIEKHIKYILEEPAVIKRLKVLVDNILIAILGFYEQIYKHRETMLRNRNSPVCQNSQQENGEQSEFNEYEKRIKNSKMTDEARNVADREFKRLKFGGLGDSEQRNIKTYLDRLLSVPWGIYTKDNLDINNLQNILDQDHFGLQQVKNRILEHMAVQQLNPEKRGTILCFVGPPGTGKTSIAHSIGRALERKIIRISLGSVRDEAEIKGHRSTYIGAMPGRIVEEMIRAGSQNPLFILDEIDKLCRDYRGDPASALLEALDPEQNFAFYDHYLGVGLDLSKALFITTANELDTIPPALLDRMEVIEFSTYTSEEKKEIAKKYLAPKQTKEAGIEKYNIHFSDAIVLEIINHYIREAGVRKLERRIGKICRKIAREVVNGEFDKKEYSITKKDLIEYLGRPRYCDTELIEMEPGNAVGLAWTFGGGDILHIEAEGAPNREEKYIITGLIGEVMLESIRVIITFLQKNKDILKIDKDRFDENEGIHVHIPAGSVPKDGPSAGVSMCAAICSLLTNKPLKKDVAYTGEITLKGRILPVGGIKEKVLAAQRAGIKKIFLPTDNKVDIDELEKYVKKGIEFVFISHIKEMLIDRAEDIFDDRESREKKSKK